MSSIHNHRHLLEKGQPIVARTWRDELINGKITGLAHRNGRVAVEFVQDNGQDAWCYLEQIRKIGDVIIGQGI